MGVFHNTPCSDWLKSHRMQGFISCKIVLLDKRVLSKTYPREVFTKKGSQEDTLHHPPWLVLDFLKTICTVPLHRRRADYQHQKGKDHIPLASSDEERPQI